MLFYNCQNFQKEQVNLLTKNKGVTLVEVLVALSLTSVVCLALAVSFTQNVHHNVQTRRLIEAEAAMKTVFANISSTPASMLPPASSYNWQAGLEPPLTPIPGPTSIVSYGNRSYRVEPSYSRVVTDTGISDTHSSPNTRRITFSVKTADGIEIIKRDMLMLCAYNLYAPPPTQTPGP